MHCDIKPCRTHAALFMFTLCALVLLGAVAEAAAAGAYRMWVREFVLTPPVFEPAATCVAPDGWVSVCGAQIVSSSIPMDLDGFLVTCRPDGDRWIRTYRHDPVTPTMDLLSDVATDRHGNIYTCDQTGATTTDALLVKYSRTGTVRWRLTIDRLDARASDRARAVAVTPDGTVCLVGETGGTPAATRAWLVAKVPPAGVVRWTTTYVGPVGHDRATDVALDDRGRVLVTGTSRSAAGDDDCVTLCFNPKSGARVWPAEARFARPGDEDAPRVSADPRGGSFVALESNLNSGAGDDVVLIKYDVSGKLRWQDEYASHYGNQDGFYGAEAWGAAAVYACGGSVVSTAPTYNARGLVLRYRP